MRVKGGVKTRKRHKKIRKMAKGYYGQKSSTFKKANEAVLKSLRYSYKHRKEKKREFRKLWITRINALCRSLGVRYNEFINALNKKKVLVNRKILAFLAVKEPESFKEIVKNVMALDGS
ncbi:MAG: 50S ribosomal protein L20 [Candidatus Hydrothermales bacterium]